MARGFPPSLNVCFGRFDEKLKRKFSTKVSIVAMWALFSRSTSAQPAPDSSAAPRGGEDHHQQQQRRGKKRKQAEDAEEPGEDEDEEGEPMVQHKAVHREEA